MRKIGILATEFDPLHNGQVEFAHRAKQQLHLDKVYLLVESAPASQVSDRRHRLNMAWLAAWDDPDLDLLPSEHTSFTAQTTLPWLEQQFPGSRFYLLLDQAAFGQLHRRPDFDLLQSKVEFVVNQTVASAQADLPAAYHGVITELAHLTSAAVRSLEHGPLSQLVPKAVAQYIASHDVYPAAVSV